MPVTAVGVGGEGRGRTETEEEGGEGDDQGEMIVRHGEGGGGVSGSGGGVGKTKSSPRCVVVVVVCVCVCECKKMQYVLRHMCNTVRSDHVHHLLPPACPSFFRPCASLTHLFPPNRLRTRLFAAACLLQLPSLLATHTNTNTSSNITTSTTSTTSTTTTPTKNTTNGLPVAPIVGSLVDVAYKMATGVGDALRPLGLKLLQEVVKVLIYLLLVNLLVYWFIGFIGNLCIVCWLYTFPPLLFHTCFMCLPFLSCVSLPLFFFTGVWYSGGPLVGGGPAY